MFWQKEKTPQGPADYTTDGNDDGAGYDGREETHYLAGTENLD